jgi:hypothetical protein
MSTNDKVGTTISGGGGVNLISADAFVEIPAENLELDISASLYYRRNQYPHLVIITSFQDTEISANSADKSTNSDFYFYDYTAKLLFDLNDKHSFRANIIGINNDLNYAEYATKTKTNLKSVSFRKRISDTEEVESPMDKCF